MRNIGLAFIYGFLASIAAVILLIGATQALDLKVKPSSPAAQSTPFSR